jgi:hypothetical protein
MTCLAPRHIRFDSGRGVLHLWRPCCGVCVPSPTSASPAYPAQPRSRPLGLGGCTRSNTTASECSCAATRRAKPSVSFRVFVNYLECNRHSLFVGELRCEYSKGGSLPRSCRIPRSGSPPSSEATSSWSTNCGKEESAHKKTRLHNKLDQQLRWVYGRIERLYPCDIAIPS